MLYSPHMNDHPLSFTEQEELQGFVSAVKALHTQWNNFEDHQTQDRAVIKEQLLEIKLAVFNVLKMKPITRPKASWLYVSEQYLNEKRRLLHLLLRVAHYEKDIAGARQASRNISYFQNDPNAELVIHLCCAYMFQERADGATQREEGEKALGHLQRAFYHAPAIYNGTIPHLLNAVKQWGKLPKELITEAAANCKEDAYTFFFLGLLYFRIRALDEASTVLTRALQKLTYKGSGHRHKEARRCIELFLEEIVHLTQPSAQ